MDENRQGVSLQRSQTIKVMMIKRISVCGEDRSPQCRGARGQGGSPGRDPGRSVWGHEVQVDAARDWKERGPVGGDRKSVV